MMSSSVELRNVTRKSSEPHSFSSATDPGQVTPIYQEAIPPKSLPLDIPKKQDYASPTGPESPLNVYDVIKDKGAASRATKRQQSENPLYGDRGTLPVVHPSLRPQETKPSNHDTSVASSSDLLRSKSESPPVGKDRRSVCCTCTLLAMLLFTLLVAITALTLAILLFVGVKPIASSSSSSSASTQAGPSCPTIPTASSTVDYQNLISQLNTTLQGLSNRVSTFPNLVAQSQGNFSANIANKLSGLTVSGYVQNFSVCQTTNVTTCGLNGTGLKNGSSSSCNTSTVLSSITGYFTMNAYCLATYPEGAYPIIATLISNTTAGNFKCNCYLVITSNDFTISPLWCSLFMTRCPTTTNISLRVV